MRRLSPLIVVALVTPARADEHLDSDDLWDLGAADGSQVTAVARARGAWVELDGGIALGGATALEHRWLIDGFPVESLASGGAETRVPLPLLDGVMIVNGGAPASSPAASGAVIDARFRDREAFRLGRAWTAAAGDDRAPGPVPEVFDPLVLDVDAPVATGGIVGGGGPLGHGAWALGGATFSVTDADATRFARRLRDADGDGRYDRADGLLELDVIDARAIDVAPTLTGTALLRAGADAGRHRVALTAIAARTDATRVSADGTPDATTIDRETSTVDGIASWSARWPQTTVAVTAGWHRSTRRDAGDGRVQIATAYIPAPIDLAEDEAVALACVDGGAGSDDPYPLIVNCPVPTGFYVRGGAGQLTDTTGDRPALRASVTHARGAHRAGAGVGGEDARWVVARRFTGGLLDRRLAENVILTTRFVEVGAGDDDCGAVGPCRWLDEAVRTYRTRHAAAWIEDAWQPAPGLELTGGLRWESMEVGESVRFRDQVLPRARVALDRGATRVVASWGRYAFVLPAGVGPDLAGGAVLHTRLDTPVGVSDVLDEDRPLAVGDLEAPFLEETRLVVAHTIADLFDVGASVGARWLRHGIEDVAGRLVHPETVPLRRETREVEAWLATTDAAPLYLRVGWARTRQRGTWPGPFDDSFDASTGNAWGRLPLDVPHRFLAEAIARRGPITAGVRFDLASGRPVGATAGPRGAVLLLPRGSVGRLPTTSAVTVHVAARRGRFELSLDLIDAFARRAPAAVDERWTLDDDVLPIEGGSEDDLVWLRDIDGGAVRRHQGYGAATVYRAPRLVRVALSATF